MPKASAIVVTDLILATVGARLGLVIHGANRKEVPGFGEPQEGVSLGGLGHERS
jgi:hypothetical protein